MIILKEGLIALPKGGVRGTLQEISEWARDSYLSEIYYHYSPNREKILSQGFVLGSQSHYDGIYFAYNKEFSKPFGEGKNPIEVRIKVNREAYLDLTKQTEKQKALISDYIEYKKEWDEWNEEDFDNLVGNMGELMSHCGFKVWSDGIQIGVMDSRLIGIIDRSEI